MKDRATFEADDRPYPGFLCILPNSVVFAVECKCADRWEDAEADRLIGGLWGAHGRALPISDDQGQEVALD